MGIVGAGDDARRLVEENGLRLRQADDLAIDGDDIFLLDGAPEAREVLSIHLDPAGLDEELGSSTGGVTAGSYELVKAHEDGLYRISLPLPSAVPPQAGSFR